ncbi:leucine-rich repeat-containing protein 42-like [Amphiura filiformis]|uniref:leucine-rich repeat-containing protein 42-like n=1 Tax=Amphiura filiformis TaxID=82378 RepID=UPI003B211FFB
MAFETFPSDSFRAYEDPGIYYVNENGRLRSPPGMGRKQTAGDDDWLALGQSPPGIINGIFLSNRHRTVSKVTCYDGTDRNVYNPKKLFDISLMFVADNIHLVESFVGFPDIVGEQLFNTTMELGKFENYRTAIVALRLFYEAYGGAVLETLSLRDRHVVLTEHLDCVVIFTGLTALDLGGCGIGNDHGILGVIGNMYCLQELCLCDNRLSDDGIQKMTTPLRIMGRGPKQLHALDLSGNPLITDLGVKYLSAYTCLRQLDLSGCTVSTQGITRIQSKIPSLRAADTDSEKNQFPITIDNHGWAVPLVQHWLSGHGGARQGKAPEQRIPEGKSKAMAFYGRIPIIPPPLFKGSKKPNQSIIQLVADKDTPSMKCDVLKPPAKRFKSSSSKPSLPLDTDAKVDSLKSKDKNTQGLTQESRNIKLSRLTHAKSAAEGSHSKDSIKRSRVRGQRARPGGQGSEKDESKVNDDDEDDLMKSYLQVRKDDGCSSQGSLWGAMGSQKW